MHGLLRLTVLAAGLLAGVAVVANAQSVSSLPPTTTPPAASSAKIYPNPGNEGQWKEEHNQTTQSANEPPERHPYSTPHFGPAPN